MNPEIVEPVSPELLRRYVQAWETSDSAGLVNLLRDDVVLSMPPIPLWYRGRADVRAFADGFLFAGQAAGRFRLLPTRANAAPAYGVYERQPDGQYRPSALQVLTITTAGQIAHIEDFLTSDPAFFKRFGLPPQL